MPFTRAVPEKAPLAERRRHQPRAAVRGGQHRPQRLVQRVPHTRRLVDHQQRASRNTAHVGLVARQEHDPRAAGELPAQLIVAASDPGHAIGTQREEAFDLQAELAGLPARRSASPRPPRGCTEPRARSRPQPSLTCRTGLSSTAATAASASAARASDSRQHRSRARAARKAQDRASTPDRKQRAERKRRLRKDASSEPARGVEPGAGIEPATSSLQNWRSTN